MLFARKGRGQAEGGPDADKDDPLGHPPTLLRRAGQARGRGHGGAQSQGLPELGQGAPRLQHALRSKIRAQPRSPSVSFFVRKLMTGVRFIVFVAINLLTSMSKLLDGHTETCALWNYATPFFADNAQRPFP